MAGIIVIQSKDWHIAGGGFCEMAAGVESYLSDSDTGRRVRDRLRMAVESELFFLDTEDFSLEMLRAFYHALNLYRQAVRNAGATEFANPDLHEGYLLRLSELSALLQESIDDSMK